MVDSIGHLPSKLRTLTDNLVASGHDFPLLKQSLFLKTLDENGVLQPDPEKLKIAMGKSFFPYRYATSILKCKTTLSLPGEEEFVELIGGEIGITKEEHDFAKHSWDVFNCSNLYQYMKVYCMIDVVSFFQAKNLHFLLFLVTVHTEYFPPIFFLF